MSEKQVVVRRGLFSFGVVLALGLVLSTMIAAGTLEKIKRSNQTITVKGYAERRIVSDLGVWSGHFPISGPVLVDAYDKLAGHLEKVLAYMERNGVKREAVEVSAVSTQVRHKKIAGGQETTEIEAYILSQSVTIKSSDIALIGKFAKESTSLIKEGVEFSSDSPEYFYTKLGDLKVQMLGEAAKDARARAEQLVGGSGSQVGALRYAEQGVFQITGPYSTDVSGYGENDTENVDKVIKAVVTIQYAVK